MKPHLQVFGLIAILSLMSCTPKAQKDTTTTSSDTTTPTPSVSDNDGSGTDTPPSSTPNTPLNPNCTGTTQDGVGDAPLLPLYNFRVQLAGHQSWLPLTSSQSNTVSALKLGTMRTIQEMSTIFKTDSKLRVRFKINSQPVPPAGEEYCYGRVTRRASDPFKYTELKFRIHLRDVICNNPDPLNSSRCRGELTLGARYQTQDIGPIQVNGCSPAINLASIRNITKFGTIIEIDDVKANSACLGGYNQYCPAEKIVRAASCWDMVMQIVTDQTQDFK